VRSAPSFQFYASDWAHSVSAMTLEERGAYITLLAWSWEHGPVPSDPKRIAAILGVEKRQASRIWSEIAHKWTRDAAQNFVNKRLESVRADSDTYRAKQAAKGRASAASRATAVTTAVTTTVQPRNQPQGEPEGQPEGNPPISTSTSYLQDQDLKIKSQIKNMAVRASRSLGEPDDFLAFWALYPKKTGRQAALKAWLKHRPDLQAVRTALEWQVRQPGWLKDRGQFIPHPATWLNAHQWDDEPFHVVADPDEQLNRLLRGQGVVLS